jgi:uncharacterized GH25 family protein
MTCTAQLLRRRRLAEIRNLRFQEIIMNAWITLRGIAPRSSAPGRWTTRATLLLLASLPLAAEAHRAFIVPSETVLSATGWITVDAAISNDLFYFNHAPMRLDNLKIIGPDGAALEAQNVNTGKFRSTFDLNLATGGTYKVAMVNDALMAQYEGPNGERKRWRGSPETLSELPADAKNLQISQMQTRVETFVTAGKPNDTALKTSGRGLEFVPVTHPNDLFAGEPASFGFVLDGKPAAGVKVTVVPGASRYRNKQNEIELTTDAAGKVSVTFPDAGMYWLEASVQDDKPSAKQAKSRRANYVATFEVLPP